MEKRAHQAPRLIRKGKKITADNAFFTILVVQNRNTILHLLFKQFITIKSNFMVLLYFRFALLVINFKGCSYPITNFIRVFLGQFQKLVTTRVGATCPAQVNNWQCPNFLFM